MSVSISQVAVVVRQLDAAMDEYHGLFGWGPWRVYDFSQISHTGTAVRGRPVSYTMRTAVTRAGGVDLELIEPGEGPSQYQEFLDQHGQGLHHVMCQGGDGARLSALLGDRGMAPLMSGTVGDGAVVYTYFDSGPEFGDLVIEVLDDGPNPATLTPSYLYTPGQ